MPKTPPNSPTITGKKRKQTSSTIKTTRNRKKIATKAPIYFKFVCKLAKKHNLPKPSHEVAGVFDQTIDMLIDQYCDQIEAKMIQTKKKTISHKIVRLSVLSHMTQHEVSEELTVKIIESGKKATENIQKI